MNQVKIKIKKLIPEAIIPNYSHDGDAGMDVYSTINFILKSRHRTAIPTGLSMEIPKGYEVQVRPKSGLAIKFGVTVLNTPGTIDSGYRGEVKVILVNHSSEDYEIKKGEKIAQIVLAKYETAQIVEAEDLSGTARGEGGFGSTGLKQ
ncbi:dUTP diphosphatase [archaeon]|jgi:dUTP pyrophosphatase|nr:dUTP diphosphatase [archaeon]